MKRAIVVGAGGQDGRLLVERLSRDRGVLGLDVGSATQHALDAVDSFDPVNLLNRDQVRLVVERVSPDEVYYLAAHHHSSEEQPDEVAELREGMAVHVHGLAHVLDAMVQVAPRCRLFYAGSSQMFGRPTTARQDERTPYAPRNAYAISKVAGAHLCAEYRERRGVHASVGILYNHESVYRGPRFVSQRIAMGAREAQRNPAHRLKLRSLSSVTDWGYAPDFVDAMVRIVGHDTPGDYVVATGEPRTVRDLVGIAFAELGLDWRAHVDEDPAFANEAPLSLVGDASKLRETTGWKPTVSFEEMVRILVRAAR
ncbi:MAG TPA: GDP-mannose 4,6-dehydratase [Polyangiaceae bacterium]|jgi:GDPmannose 4,6-dehydratase